MNRARYRDEPDLQTITRFTCNGCGKTHDKPGSDDGKQTPPKTWRFLEIKDYRAQEYNDHQVVGLVCSVRCAEQLVAASWPPVSA